MLRPLSSIIALFALTTVSFASPDDDLARGREALQKRDIVEAMAAFTAVLEADPGHGAAAYERGVLLLLIGEPDNAIADFTVAIIADPQNGRALARRGEAKLVLGDATSAAADFDQAVATSPKDSEVYVLRATFRLKAGDIGGALSDLELAVPFADPETATRIRSMLDRLRP
jgi:tetratricopeptide (TPR) repeat protein